MRTVGSTAPGSVPGPVRGAPGFGGEEDEPARPDLVKRAGGRDRRRLPELDTVDLDTALPERLEMSTPAARATEDGHAGSHPGQHGTEVAADGTRTYHRDFGPARAHSASPRISPAVTT